jgi:hypothetical protein
MQSLSTQLIGFGVVAEEEDGIDTCSLCGRQQDSVPMFGFVY